MSAEPTQSSGRRRHAADPLWVQWTLIAAAISVLAVLVVIPVVNVFVNAFADGLAGYWSHVFGDPDTRHAILLTLLVAPTAVAFNIVFGIAAAWAIARALATM